MGISDASQFLDGFRNRFSGIDVGGEGFLDLHPHPTKPDGCDLGDFFLLRPQSSGLKIERNEFRDTQKRVEMASMNWI